MMRARSSDVLLHTPKSEKMSILLKPQSCTSNKILPCKIDAISLNQLSENSFLMFTIFDSQLIRLNYCFYLYS